MFTTRSEIEMSIQGNILMANNIFYHHPKWYVISTSIDKKICAMLKINEHFMCNKRNTLNVDDVKKG